MTQQENTAANPIAGWVFRQIDKGYKGFELLIREGASHALVERYAAERGSADAIYADARDNAQGLDMPTYFTVRALNDGPGPYPSRSFFIAASLPMHEPERFEERNVVRLLLEHIDKQNRVMTEVVPACLVSMGSMVQGLSSHFGTLAETHEAAARTLRESRVDSVEGERAMLHEASRQARMDKMLDTGIALLPQILEKLAREKK